jgi:hypothetical protein
VGALTWAGSSSAAGAEVERVMMADNSFAEADMREVSGAAEVLCCVPVAGLVAEQNAGLRQGVGMGGTAGGKARACGDG